VVVDLSQGFVKIAAGGQHSLALKADGAIVAWGGNAYGQCNVPAPNTGSMAVAAGAYHGLGLKADGSIVAWGYNSDGQCNVPAPNTGFVALAAGGDHSLGLKAFYADLNCDGAVNFNDIEPFVTALVSRATYVAEYPRCHWLNADINADGRVTFDDVNPFVTCLVQGGCP
jgi:hypothetical protein